MLNSLSTGQPCDGHRSLMIAYSALLHPSTCLCWSQTIAKKKMVEHLSGTTRVRRSVVVAAIMRCMVGRERHMKQVEWLGERRAIAVTIIYRSRLSIFTGQTAAVPVEDCRKYTKDEIR